MGKTNRIYHQSLMQTAKSLPEGKRIMLETRFTVNQRVVISRSASIFFLSYDYLSFVISFFFDSLRHITTFFLSYGVFLVVLK